MDEAKELADLSARLADPARAAIVLSLMDGSSRPTGELQMAANLLPSSASAHLARLVSARVLSVVKRGRLKYYRISSAAVAHAIESLSIVASPGSVIREAARSPINPFSFAQTCYDHLAGKLGVEIAAALQGKGIIRPSGRTFEVSESGARWLREFGVDCDELKSERRMFATQCLDFTERRHHLGGALGAALLARMIELRWLATPPIPRSIRLTLRGRTELERRLNLEFASLQKVRYRKI